MRRGVSRDYALGGSKTTIEISYIVAYPISNDNSVSLIPLSHCVVQRFFGIYSHKFVLFTYFLVL